MAERIETILREAKVARDAGRLEASREAYRRAAELARTTRDEPMLAFALRHVADLDRECGNAQDAVHGGQEAVQLYRALSDSGSLDLANALRVTALALQDLGRKEEAAPLWREARDLYASFGVDAGVEECESHIGSAN